MGAADLAKGERFAAMMLTGGNCADAEIYGAQAVPFGSLAG
jgi:hypothetical protein